MQRILNVFAEWRKVTVTFVIKSCYCYIRPHGTTVYHWKVCREMLWLRLLLSVSRKFNLS